MKLGWTALYAASHNGHDGVVKILLKAGLTEINIQTVVKFIASQFAVHYLQKT